MPVKLGKPLKLTDEQLEKLAQVTPADMEEARALWRRAAPEEWQDLLDAQPVPEEDELS